MRPTEPPAIATWLLEHIGRKNQSLTGDLLEEYRQGRSVAWYWRQVTIAIVLGRSKEVLLVLGMIALYRIATHIPIPGANAQLLALLGHPATRSRISMYDLITGGNLSSVTVFALGIMPFISASILVQVVALGWWFLTRRRATPWELPIVRSTWAVAVLLALVQAAGLALFLERQDSVTSGLQFVYAPGWTFRVSTMLTLTAGSACLMWIGDRITERHIGNGMFLLFFAGLLAGLPGLAAVSGVSFALRHLVIPVAVVGVTSHNYRRAFQGRLFVASAWHRRA